ADARSLDPGLGRGVTRQARDVLDRARCVEDARFGEVRAYGMDGSAAGLPQVRVALVDPGKELQLRGRPVVLLDRPGRRRIRQYAFDAGNGPECHLLCPHDRLAAVHRDDEIEAAVGVAADVQYHRLEYQRIGQIELVAVEGDQHGGARGERGDRAVVGVDAHDLA